MTDRPTPAEVIEQFRLDSRVFDITDRDFAEGALAALSDAGYAVVEKHVLGDLTLAKKRAVNRVGDLRQKRDRWRERHDEVVEQRNRAVRLLAEVRGPLNEDWVRAVLDDA